MKETGPLKVGQSALKTLLLQETHQTHFMFRIFYFCIVALMIFEFLNWILLVPLPFRENINYLPLAHSLFKYRWYIRIELVIGIMFGIIGASNKSKRSVLILSSLTLVTIYLCDFKYATAWMYRRPSPKVMIHANQNKEDLDKLIVGVVKNCEARAFPVQYLAYHHRVLDGMCGKRFMVTFFPVTRTAKVYLTDYKGKNDYYRYLGMINNDAIYEDTKSGTWWSQSTGKGIAGERKGESLREWPCYVTTLREWLKYNPESSVMQADKRYDEEYKKLQSFEYGAPFEGFSESASSIEEGGLKISEQYQVSEEEEQRLKSRMHQLKMTSFR